jgi:hypothetical protein
MIRQNNAHHQRARRRQGIRPGRSSPAAARPGWPGECRTPKIPRLFPVVIVVGDDNDNDNDNDNETDNDSEISIVLH